MNLSRYDEKMIRITDPEGRAFTGIARSLPSGYCLHEFGREEEGLQIGETVFFAVGLAHLVGEDGIVNSLRNLGYTVEPVRYGE